MESKAKHYRVVGFLRQLLIFDRYWIVIAAMDGE